MSHLTGTIGFSRGLFVMEVAFAFSLRHVTALFGPSGSGKTTLLRILAGLEPKAKGKLIFANQVWQDDEKHIFVPPHQRAIGFVFQEARLFSHLNVEGNLTYGFNRTQNRKQRLSMAEMVAMLELSPLLHRHPGSLSGGEKQRVALGRTLLSSPEILLLDEPLASLDENSRLHIVEYLNEIRQRLDLPFVYVSHSLSEVERLADELVMMEAGQLIASGPLATMLTRLDLSLAHAKEAASIIEAEVEEYETDHHVTRLRLAQKYVLYLPGHQGKVGETMRLRLLARDVSLTLDPPGRTSILNILPAQVVDISQEYAGQILLRLQVGEMIILARITEKSLNILEIREKLNLFVQIKSISLDLDDKRFKRIK